MNRKRCFIGNVLILSILCISILPQIPITGYFENRQVPNAAYTPHDSIEIKSNAELADFCSSSGSGSGTLEDPYIIENFQISGNTTGIYISNTNLHLCIRNNEISNQDTGILLENTLNINISNNSMLNISFGSIYVNLSNNTSVIENTITDGNYGICIRDSNHSYIQSNIIRRMNNTGIPIDDSNYGKISANIIEDCILGVELDYGNQNFIFTNNLFTRCGIYLNGPSYNISIDTSNKANGKSIRFYEEKNGISLINEMDVGQLILIGVNNSEFRGFNVSYASIGIWAMNSHNNTFSDIISNYNSHSGIGLLYSLYNSITLNKFEFNDHGISLAFLTDNVVAGNLIKNNTVGINLLDAGLNKIYYNTFILNEKNVNIYSSNNYWHDGKKGNYWGDYTMKCPSASHDGKIWNTQYVIEGLEIDRYPLAYVPFTLFGTPNLSTTSNKNSYGVITLHWNPITEAECYLVYRANYEITSVEGLTPIANTTSIVYTENVAVGRTYYYAIIAVNEFKRSDISNSVKIEVTNQPEEPEEEEPSTIDGFPLAMFGIVCVVTLIVKRRRVAI